MKRRKKILIGCATVMAAIIGATVIHHYRVKRAVERYKAELCAQGELLIIEKCLPPPIPEERNSTPLYLLASANLPQSGVIATNNPRGMIAVSPGKAMSGWAQPEVLYVYRGSTDSNTWNEVGTEISKLEPTLKLLNQIPFQSSFDFEIDYNQGFTVELSHLSDFKTSARVLASAAFYDLRETNYESAIKNVEAILQLANGLQDEPSTMSQLVRFSVVGTAMAATWELLQIPEIHDEQLAALQDKWTKLEFCRPAEAALEMERACILATNNEMRESSANYRQILDLCVDRSEIWEKAVWSEIRIKCKEGLWRWSWSFKDEQRSLNGIQILLSTTRSCQSNLCFIPLLNEQQNQLEKIKRSIPDWTYIIDGRGNRVFGPQDPANVAVSHMWTSSLFFLNRFLNDLAKTETSRSLTVTAIAIRRFQMNHGRLPESLLELVPDYLTTLSIDPMNGETLQYHINTNGEFALYSVGEDGVDDGGDPTPTDDSYYSQYWSPGRDWVWPQPASREDVQTYWINEIRKAEGKSLINEETGKPYYLEGAVPVIDPENGRPARNPETYEMILTSQPKAIEEAESAEKRAEALAYAWTQQYFHTLTNAGD